MNYLIMHIIIIYAQMYNCISKFIVLNRKKINSIYIIWAASSILLQIQSFTHSFELSKNHIKFH